MINVRRLTVISLCVASACAGNVTLQAQDAAIGAQQRDSVYQISITYKVFWIVF